ncbi:hypothetical protein GCK72_004826 [Caenorhabditis remanei]|uniref:Uncharacterized protein n=1 Tax=Caenorhabditis remanei TaxID=31234 RepID=A0A6A5HC75_CAERE|nr:hypothetical protein GCK72_004826 [Caenorhabditis remanei]KAF1764875.1 hypothetical protein GCK72_004826 [Caenorhabditis remanei]
MNLLLLIIVPITVIIPDVHSQNDATDSTKTSSSPSLNCDFLNDSFSYKDMTYNGECCNTDAVEFMDTEHPLWRFTTLQWIQESYLGELFARGDCNISSTSTVEQSTTVLTSTTTVPETTTTIATTESSSTILMTEADPKASRKYGRLYRQLGN